MADIARISIALTTACAQIRQARKAEIRSLAKTPLNTIIEYLRTLPDSQQSEVVTVLTGAEAEEPLL